MPGFSVVALPERQNETFRIVLNTYPIPVVAILFREGQRISLGCPHEIRGQGIYCYVTLMNGTEPSEQLQRELNELDNLGDTSTLADPDVVVDLIEYRANML